MRRTKAGTEQTAPKHTRKAKPEQSLLGQKSKDKTGLPSSAEETILVQYAGQELNVGELRKQVIAAHVEAGHRAGRISKLNVYIKPEEQKVYYVVNDKISGSIDV
jgi:hypothetical protein